VLTKYAFSARRGLNLAQGVPGPTCACVPFSTLQRQHARLQSEVPGAAADA
jgi:hypothetical protein